MKKYELIEHTADLGIRVKGRDLKGLFQNVASSLFEIIARREEKKPCKKKEIKIKQSAQTREELLVNWLNELISLSATKNLIFCDFKIGRMDDSSLEAVVLGEPAQGYRLKTEVKAATYHELKLMQSKSGWQAEVIFDV
ncbi:MAG: archease [Candidatus Omnitrophica bacterium]|nr:archease [Candidatus Omnitrophota bacterium]MDD5236417.1 archease [Candidatus Omnitrophota bacterium]MDD5610110.1 archease [Candidatus Omnitrophota bacterium]